MRDQTYRNVHECVWGEVYDKIWVGVAYDDSDVSQNAIMFLKATNFVSILQSIHLSERYSWRKVFHNIWRKKIFFAFKEKSYQKRFNNATTPLLTPDSLCCLFYCSAEMAGRFFKSFFPSVKAQEDAELVNPQEVLRVSCFNVIKIQELLTFIFLFFGLLGGMCQGRTHWKFVYKIPSMQWPCELQKTNFRDLCGRVFRLSSWVGPLRCSLIVFKTKVERDGFRSLVTYYNNLCLINYFA